MADYIKNLGTITGYGSPLWKQGLDVGAKKGSNLTSPASGTVMFAGKKGGWGNQVVVRDANGNDIQLSHLDAVNVKVGDKVVKNQPLGLTGNTGSVLKMNGQAPTADELAAGRGAHVDITIKDGKGSYVDPKNVQSLLNTKDVKIGSDFNIRVNKSRQAGQSDSQILDYLSSQDYNLKKKIEASRATFGKNPQGISNDRDLINFLAVKYSGQAPTVKSVGGPMTGEETYLKNNKTNVTPDTVDQFKKQYDQIKNVRNQYIVEASKYDVPKAVVEGMFDRGEYDRLDQFVKDAAMVKGIKDEQELNKGFLGQSKQLINGMWDAWTNMPGVKQAGNIVGKGVGGTVGVSGGIIGALVAALGQPIINAAKGKPLTDEWWNSIKANAQKTAQFGYNTGSQGGAMAVQGAPLAALGAIPTLAMAGAQAAQGGQTMGTSIENKDIVGKFQAGTELAGAGLLGVGSYAQIKSGNLLGNRGMTNAIQKQSDLLFKAKAIKANQTELTNLYNKAVLPSGTKKRTVPQEAAYNKAVNDTAFDIARNKNKITYTDANGETRTGLPQSLADTKEAVYQGKINVWNNTIKPMLDKTGKKLNISLNEKTSIKLDDGTTIKQSPVDVLDSVINDPRIARFEPGVVKYAERLKNDYNKAVWTPDELNLEIKVLNNRSKVLYTSSDPKIIQKALVDKALADNLRALLDDKITSVEGPGFQQSKNLYGSYKKIEADISRATNRAANKPTLGFSDLLSAEQLIEGLITMNPSAIARGAVIKGIKLWAKKYNSPDANIKRMFQKADSMVPKLPSQPARPTAYSPSTEISTMGNGSMMKPGNISPKLLLGGGAAVLGGNMLESYVKQRQEQPEQKTAGSTPIIAPKVEEKLKATTPSPVVKERVKNKVGEEYYKNITVKIDSKGQNKKNNGKATIAESHNNPGNLLYAGQPNAVKGQFKGINPENGAKMYFAKFSTPELGFRGLVKQVMLDQTRKLSLEEFLKKYAPASENDLPAYLAFLEDNVGIKKGNNIAGVDPISLAKAVAKFESQTEVTEL